MSSKWMKEVQRMIDNEDVWEIVEPKLQEVDELLLRAMFAKDSDDVFFDILTLRDELEKNVVFTLREDADNE